MIRDAMIAIVAAGLLLCAAQAFAGGDDGYTVTLMHFNSDLTDATGKTWTALAGTPIATSTQSKFGGGSLYLNGSSGITTANVDAFDFGKGDWTIDWWEYPTAAYHLLFSRDSSAVSGFNMNGEYGGPGYFLIDADGIGPYVDVAVYPGEITASDWSHMAVVRSGNTMSIYKNGIMTHAQPIFSGVYAGQDGIRIGQDRTSVYFTGYIDELRISKGIARWTEAFTPPSAEYTEASPVVDVGPELFIAGSGRATVKSGGMIYLKE